MKIQIPTQPLWCAVNRQALQLQLQPNDKIGFNKLAFGRQTDKILLRNAIILVNISDNLTKLSWTRTTNLVSVQELKRLWNQT